MSGDFTGGGIKRKRSKKYKQRKYQKLSGGFDPLKGLGREKELEKEEEEAPDDGRVPMDNNDNIPVSTFKVTSGAAYDRSLLNVEFASVTDTQVDKLLVTIGFPCEITGFRWKIVSVTSAAISYSFGRHVLQFVREASNVGTVNQTDGTTLCAPEADVILYDLTASSDNTQAGLNKTISTASVSDRRSNRRYKAYLGDRVYYSSIFDAGQITNGILEFFCNA